MTVQYDLSSERVCHSLGWHYPDWRDFELHLSVSGRLTPKKNHLQPIRVGGHGSIAPDKEYKQWERRAHAEMVAQWSAVFSEPIPDGIEINLRVVTYLPDRRSWPDLSATYEGPQDVLEAHRARCDTTWMPRAKTTKCRRHAGILVNDKWVCGHVGSDRRIDKAAPRVDLTITPYQRALYG